MSEGAPVTIEQPKKDREASYREVCATLQQSLDVLEEAYKTYPVVTFPNGETREPENAPEEVLGRVQRYKEAIDGLLEKNVETHLPNEALVEEALRLSQEGVKHLEGYLAVQADLYILAKENNAGAEELATILDTIAHTLITLEERKNN